MSAPMTPAERLAEARGCLTSGQLAAATDATERGESVARNLYTEGCLQALLAIGEHLGCGA